MTGNEEPRRGPVEPASRLELAKPKRPVGRPPKHGAFSGSELVPIARAKASEIIEVLTGDKVAIGNTDRVIIGLLAGNLAKITLLDRYFASVGIFDEENKVRASELKIYYAALNSAARTCDQLGMTPQSRVRLGISMIQAKRDLATMMDDAARRDGDEEPA